MLENRWIYRFGVCTAGAPLVLLNTCTEKPGEPVSTHPAYTCVCKPVTALGLRPRIALSSAQAKSLHF